MTLGEPQVGTSRILIARLRCSRKFWDSLAMRHGSETTNSEKSTGQWAIGGGPTAIGRDNHYYTILTEDVVGGDTMSISHCLKIVAELVWGPALN